VTSNHKDLLIHTKTKALHRLNDERLCSTDGNVADEKLNSNGYATSYLRKKVVGYGVISCRRDVTAHQRITRCLEIQHRAVATRIARARCLRFATKFAVIPAAGDLTRAEFRNIRLNYVFAIDEGGVMKF